MPPPDYVKSAPAWLRLGKIAALSVLAALSAAIGLALPAGQDAAAQGASVHQGYTYTQRQCQELGRQPRRYNVREPIAGSDWRNDGGWAIVLIRSQTTRELTGFRLDMLWTSVAQKPNIEVLPHAPRTLRIDYRNGRHAYLWRQVGGGLLYDGGFPQAFIDVNKDGDIDEDDGRPHPTNPSMTIWREYVVVPVTYAEPIGATYTRWANMLWCR